MAKIRINRDYGVAPNALIDNEEISLKAKGLYISIQSKPDDWNFSAIGLAGKNKDGKASVQAGLQELEKFGWLERIKTRNSQGQWDIEYILHSRSTVSENQTPSNAENQTRHRDRLSVDGKSANNNKKQHTKNINTISNDIVLSSQQNCDDKMPKKEKDFSLKNSKTDSEINSEGQNGEIIPKTAPQKKSSAAASDSFSAIRNLDISGTPKTTRPELAERRVKLLEFFRKSVGLDKFRDYSEWQEVGRMEKLIEKLGRDEFLMRMKSILENEYLLRKCNYLSFLRKEIESYIHSPQFEPTLSHKPSRVG